MKLKDLLAVMNDQETHVVIRYPKWTAVSDGYLGDLKDFLLKTFGDKKVTDIWVNDEYSVYDAALVIDIED